jgi:ubiquinone/menaquinone biosynthesis C-methylase UbiE
MVIGVDMTPQMLDKARKNAKKNNITNVEFRLGEIEYLPVADQSVDVVISNCVVNLSPNKEQVFSEINRVLKQTGRIVISDIVLSRDMPEKVKAIMTSANSCGARALTQEEYQDGFSKFGIKTHFSNIQYIKPQRKGEIIDKGNVKRKLLANGKEHEIELTAEEDKKMETAILKAYIVGQKG